jgi:hypothetical protein
MKALTEHEQTALSLVMRWFRNGGIEKVKKNLPYDAMRWSSQFNEWQGTNTAQRWYFNDPENPNSKQYAEIQRDGSIIWHSDHRLKRDQKAAIDKMKAAHEKAKEQLTTAFNAALSEIPAQLGA